MEVKPFFIEVCGALNPAGSGRSFGDIGHWKSRRHVEKGATVVVDLRRLLLDALANSHFNRGAACGASRRPFTVGIRESSLRSRHDAMLPELFVSIPDSAMIKKTIWQVQNVSRVQ